MSFPAPADSQLLLRSRLPPKGTVIGDHKLEIDPVIKCGYLTVTTDAKTMTITFKTAPRGAPVTQVDFVTVDLVRGKNNRQREHRPGAENAQTQKGTQTQKDGNRKDCKEETLTQHCRAQDSHPRRRLRSWDFGSRSMD